MSIKSKGSRKPLPLSDVLRDLALLRASGHDLSNLSAASKESLAEGSSAQVDATVATSYDFIREARAAIKLHNSKSVDKQGGRIEDIRNSFEDLNNGLRAH
ncbi:hypothetical protein B0H34DRAFT_360849 [Crassisporium funariophilum]|nr:hypothetical protein B0H34DRAFT_360849 [Crassisporium funariophilum]